VSETQDDREEVQYPISPPAALKLFKEQMSMFELAEILDYPRVYFLGLSSPKVRKNQKFNNYGFDDENGDYNFVIGDHLGYKYEVMQLLGKGSFGQVLRCYDHKEKDYVAVKIIKNKKRFHQQAAIELKILEFISKNDQSEKHHLIHYKDSFLFRHHLCLVFEMLSSNLYEVLKLNNFQGFPLKIVRNITIQLLYGLFFLNTHKIIHCDLKPENILLLKSNKSSIKIIDFGSSCFEGEQLYSYIQSRFYRAPEIILGLSYSTSIDMWSLGCVISELILGYPVFPGENEREQLLCIMEILGLPPAGLIEKSPKKAEFFRNKEALIFPNSQGKLRTPASRSIQDKLRCHDENVIDFVLSKFHLECFAWNPQDRMSPEEALKHPWITCK
jgi:dual specificity tyrosine-phosphorylation-regulated kinase 2/3/4